MVDFTRKTVIDVGSVTGKLSLIAAPKAAAVYAVDPIANLREYLKDKVREQGFSNIFTVDDLITDCPIPRALLMS